MDRLVCAHPDLGGIPVDMAKPTHLPQATVHESLDLERIFGERIWLEQDAEISGTVPMPATSSVVSPRRMLH
jgi:hypothetical protein